jgi:DNA-directed RNA polymerase alpha subunit
MSAIVESESESEQKIVPKSPEMSPFDVDVPRKTMEWANNIISRITLRPLEETDDVFKFTLAGLNVSLANAIRRTVQDDIPVYVFDIDNCKIDVNTGRLHNEILKHRLQCIPIHSKVITEDWLLDRADSNIFEKYVMELDVQNDGEQTIYVTTSDFNIKNKTTGRSLTAAEMDRLFPKDKITNSNVIFARLRPKISDSVPGEHLKLSCEFKISHAAENSAFSAVCCSAYGNTIDLESADKAWENAEQRLREDATKRGESVDPTEIEFQKKNFQILDRQRHFVNDSFDFNVESIGIYNPRELCRSAADMLKFQFDKLANDIESDNTTILNSETTMENCFDFILEHGDYTIGKVLEFILYDKLFAAKGKKPVLQFCGFKKMHPHDDHSIIRVSYLAKEADKTMFKNHLKESCEEASLIFKAISTKF